MSGVSDFYPSRIDDTPSTTVRSDPVIHGDEAREGPLSRGQLEAFERNGYLLIEHFLSTEELRTLNGERDALWTRAVGSDADEIIREPDSAVVRSIFAIHRTNAIFRRLAQDRRIVRAVEQILGRGVYVHQSRINYKAGFSGKEFYWHSDFETWHVEDGMPRMRALSVLIALSDNMPVNGPLMLIPGSHKYYVHCLGGTPAENHYRSSLRRQEYGVPDEDSLAWLAERGGLAAPTGSAGSLIMFECNAMHGSNSNITPFPRSNVFFAFNSIENALVEPFGGTKPRPEHIASRDFTPVAPA